MKTMTQNSDQGHLMRKHENMQRAGLKNHMIRTTEMNSDLGDSSSNI